MAELPPSPSKSGRSPRKEIIVGRTRSPHKAVQFYRSGARVTSGGSSTTASTRALLSKLYSNQATSVTSDVPETPSDSAPNPFLGDPIKLAPPTQPVLPSQPSLVSTPRRGRTSPQLEDAKDDDWLDIEDEKESTSVANATANATANTTTNITTNATNATVNATKNATAHTSSFAGFSPSTSRRRSRWSWYRSFTSSSPNDSIDASSMSGTPSRSPYNMQVARPYFQPQPTSGEPSKPKQPSFWLSPQFPALMAMYLQLGFNAGMVFLLSYVIGVFYHTISRDVNMKVEEYSMEVVNKMAQCSQEYLRNNCEPSKRVPALDAVCTEWEHCMNQDPRAIGRAKVSAETFGEIVESFLKPIGLKSMLFLIFLFAGSFILVNMVFSSRIGPRFNVASTQAAPPPPPMQSMPVPMQAMPEQMYTPNTYARAHGTPLHTPNVHTPYYLGYPVPSGRFSFSPGYHMSPRAPTSARSHRRRNVEMI